MPQLHSTARRASLRLCRPIGFLFCLVGLVLCPRVVAAKPNFPPVVLATYHLKAGGVVQQAANSCSLCHVGPPKLNPYGQSLKAALRQQHAKMLTADILHSVESQDADGDGFTNGEEFAADTLPGDATSKPPGKPAAAPSAAAASAPKVPDEPGLFSPQTLLFPRHAQHRVLVHFPIALFIVSLFFDLLGYFKKNPLYRTVGYVNLTVAAVTAPLAVISGLLAWWFAYGGVAFTGLLLYHLVLGIVTTLFLVALWAIRAKQKGNLEGRTARLYTVLSAVAFVTLTLTGHIGGALVTGG